MVKIKPLEHSNPIYSFDGLWKITRCKCTGGKYIARLASSRSLDQNYRLSHFIGGWSIWRNIPFVVAVLLIITVTSLLEYVPAVTYVIV